MPPTSPVNIPRPSLGFDLAKEILNCSCNTGTETCRQNFCIANSSCYYFANVNEEGSLFGEKYGCTGSAHVCQDFRNSRNITLKTGLIRLCCSQPHCSQELRHLALIEVEKLGLKPKTDQPANYWPYVVALIVFVVIFLGFYFAYKIFEGVKNSVVDDESISDREMLKKRTAGYDVSIDPKTRLGGGSFGWVYSSMYKGDPVAVKVFEPENLSSFNLEKQIYKKFHMSPDLVLRFYFADIKTINGVSKGILVTELCDLGSLHDVLKRRHPPFTCSTDQCLAMCLDIVKGLDFLHRRIVSCDRIEKLEIVHRDLKSSNILLRPGYRCVIGDFGFSMVEDLQKSPSRKSSTDPDLINPDYKIVKKNQDYETLKSDRTDYCCCFGRATFGNSGNLDEHNQKPITAPEHFSLLDENATTEYRNQEFIVGTRRYMAPELMNRMINVFNFEAYKKTDVYALGLIMWEIRSRTIINGIKPVLPYMLPYEEYETCDRRRMDGDFLKKLVVFDEKRPTFSFNFNDRRMMKLESLVSECWSPKPENRPVAYKCKKILSSLI